jgi:hypothetical protein
LVEVYKRRQAEIIDHKAFENAPAGGLNVEQDSLLKFVLRQRLRDSSKSGFVEINFSPLKQNEGSKKHFTNNFAELNLDSKDELD